MISMSLTNPSGKSCGSISLGGGVAVAVIEAIKEALVGADGKMVSELVKNVLV